MRLIALVFLFESVFGFTGFQTQTRVRLQQSLKLSPGEVDASPSPIAQGSSKQLQKLALPIAALATLVVPFLSAQAEETAAIAPPSSAVAPVETKVELGPAPTDFGLSYKDFYGDSIKIVNHMRYATLMEKGNPLLAEIAQKTKDEMLDYVSYYRRFTGVSGKQTFSLLYTSINVLSGHYTSYGTKFPVPEKRRKRLLQEYNDIEKNIRKKR